MDDAVSQAGDAAASAPAVQSGPRVALRLPVGSGKTERETRRIAARLAAAPTLRWAVAVPSHQLADEFAARLRRALGAVGLPPEAVMVWRGTEQPDPGTPGTTMCRRPGDVERLRRAGGEMAALCAVCPQQGACGHQRQAKGTAGVRVLIVPHVMLGAPAPQPFRREGQPAFDGLTVDENPMGALLEGFGPLRALPLDDLDPGHWQGAAYDAPGEPAGWGATRIGAALSGIADAAQASPAGGVGLDVVALRRVLRVAAGGGDPGGLLADVRVRVWRGKPDVAADLAMFAGDETRQRAILAALPAHGGRIVHVRDAVELVEAVLAGRAAPGAVRLGKTAPGGADALLLRWMRPIHRDWAGGKAGVALLDATMALDAAGRAPLVEALLPGVRLHHVPATANPHVRVRQVWDRTLGYRTVIPGRDAANRAAVERRVDELARAVGRLARDYRGRGASGGPDVLLVAPKELVARLEPARPGNVGVAWFGALRGLDRFKGVAAALIVSRPLPGPGVVEDMAEAISGRPAHRLPPGPWYPKRPVHRVRQDAARPTEPAEAVYHPDPLAEAVRWAACEGELIQAIGRVRPLRRGAADPVEVFLLTDVPLGQDAPVAETLTLEDARLRWGMRDPVADFAEAGVLPLDWPGRGLVLRRQGWFAGAADPGDAAEQWFRRHPEARRELDDLATRGAGMLPASGASFRHATIESSYGGMTETRAEAALPPATPAPVWIAYRYALAGGQTKRQLPRVLIHPRHPDPRAAAEAAGLAPLALFEPGATSRPRHLVKPAPAVPQPQPEVQPVPPADPVSVAAPAPVTLPAILHAAGVPPAALRAHLLRPGVKRDLRALQARGWNEERARAVVAAGWLGPARWANAVAQAQRATLEAA